MPQMSSEADADMWQEQNAHPAFPLPACHAFLNLDDRVIKFT